MPYDFPTKIQKLTPIKPYHLVSNLHFRDKELLDCVCNTAQINRWQSIEEFETLTCHKADLYWLDGIEQLSHLTCLELKSDILENFTPLKSMTSLTHLTIETYKFNDFTVLENMKQLTHLAIRSHLPMGDASILDNLPNLVYVNLG